MSNASITSDLFCSEVACVTYPTGSESSPKHFRHLCIEAVVDCRPMVNGG
jgi:hypothetical protein